MFWGMKMKKQGNAFLVVCSLLLIAACLFSVYSGVRGFNDCMKHLEAAAEDASIAG